MVVLLNWAQSALTLLVTGVGANHTDHALASDDLAVAADFFDRSRNSHVVLLKLFQKLQATVGPKHNSCPGQIAGRQLMGDFVNPSF
jgi:hypothetical protein